VPQLLATIVASHRAAVDAIEDRDPARARALTEEHIETRTMWSIELRLQQIRDEGAAALGREVS
jgi:DNA-binding GntR family transcriptional regulator